MTKALNKVMYSRMPIIIIIVVIFWTVPFLKLVYRLTKPCLISSINEAGRLTGGNDNYLIADGSIINNCKAPKYVVRVKFTAYNHEGNEQPAYNKEVSVNKNIEVGNVLKYKERLPISKEEAKMNYSYRASIIIE